MNSRLRDSIGLSTSPVTGSNVHLFPFSYVGKMFIYLWAAGSAAFLDAQSGSKR